MHTDTQIQTCTQIHTHTPRAGEMFQSLRAHTAFVENPNLVPSTHTAHTVGLTTAYNLSSIKPNNNFWLLQELALTCTYPHKNKTNTHNLKPNLKFLFIYGAKHTYATKYMCMGQRKLPGVSQLPFHHKSQGLSSGQNTWQQVPMPTQPSHWPYFFVLKDTFKAQQMLFLTLQSLFPMNMHTNRQPSVQSHSHVYVVNQTFPLYHLDCAEPCRFSQCELVTSPDTTAQDMHSLISFYLLKPQLPSFRFLLQGSISETVRVSLA